MSKTYTVNVVIQGGAPGSEPTEVQWYKGTNGMQAISALASAAVNDEDRDWGNLPDDMRYRILSVDMKIEEV